jgi:Putative MetA-pathway of phenol degradation
MLWRSLFVAVAFAAVATGHPTSCFASCGSESCPLDHASRWSERPFTFELSYQYLDQDQPRIGTYDTDVGAIPRHHDEVRTLNRITTARAGLRRGAWSLGASLPFVDRYHAHIHNHNGEQILDEWNYSGLGDLEVVGLRSFGPNANRFLGALRTFVSAGVKMPTGDTSVPNENGDQPEPAARPGTGSWDVMAGLGLEWSPGSIFEHNVPVRLSVNGRWNGYGTEDYRIGPELQVHVGTEYPLSSRVALLGQANFRARGKDDVAGSGVEEDDTGGSLLYLSPGARYTVSPRASIYGLVQLPAYQRVNGIQVVSEANLYVGVTGGL